MTTYTRYGRSACLLVVVAAFLAGCAGPRAVDPASAHMERAAAMTSPARGTVAPTFELLDSASSVCIRVHRWFQSSVQPRETSI